MGNEVKPVSPRLCSFAVKCFLRLEAILDAIVTGHSFVTIMVVWKKHWGQEKQIYVQFCF
jgi:hypothetical protein